MFDYISTPLCKSTCCKRNQNDPRSMVHDPRRHEVCFSRASFDYSNLCLVWQTWVYERCSVALGEEKRWEGLIVYVPRSNGSRMISWEHAWASGAVQITNIKGYLLQCGLLLHNLFTNFLTNHYSPPRTYIGSWFMDQSTHSYYLRGMDEQLHNRLWNYALLLRWT